MVTSLDSFDRVLSSQETRTFLLSVARKYHVPESAREDLIQDTLLAGYKHKDQYDAARPFRPWIARVLINRHIEIVRAAGRRNEKLYTDLESPIIRQQGFIYDRSTPYHLFQRSADRPSNDPLSLACIKEAIVQLWEGIYKLPEEKRSVLVNTHIYEHSYREISNQLGIALGTVKSRIHASMIELSSYIR